MTPLKELVGSQSLKNSSASTSPMLSCLRAHYLSFPKHNFFYLIPVRSRPTRSQFWSLKNPSQDVSGQQKIRERVGWGAGFHRSFSMICDPTVIGLSTVFRKLKYIRQPRSRPTLFTIQEPQNSSVDQLYVVQKRRFLRATVIEATKKGRSGETEKATSHYFYHYCVGNLISIRDIFLPGFPTDSCITYTWPNISHV